MSVTVGQPVPQARVEAYVRGEVEPRSIDLSEYHGRWLVLFFYPRDFTFICPTEIAAFAMLAPEFEQENAAVLGASTDSYHSHKAWFESDARLLGVDYPVIADSAHTLAQAFGVLSSDGSAFRATFVTDPAGVLRHVLINDSDRDGGGVGRNVDDTLRTLRALRTGELCPASWQPGESTLSRFLAATPLS